jgi:hypothetical protein
LIAVQIQMSMASLLVSKVSFQTRTQATEEPKPVPADPPPISRPARPEDGIGAADETERRSPLEAAREAGGRAEMDEDDRGAAPGAIRSAQRIGKAIHDETKVLARGDSGLSREQRAEIREATHELRHELRDIARDASADEGFDVAAFASGAADAVEDFLESFASTLGIELEADGADGDEVEADDDADTTDDPAPNRDGEPVPTQVGNEP